MNGDPIFESRNEILTFDKALKFGVIFSKRCIKINKELKMYRKIQGKCNFLGKIRNIMWIGDNNGFEGNAPRWVEDFTRNLSNW